MMGNGQQNKQVKNGKGIQPPFLKPRLVCLREAAGYLGRTVWSMRELIWSGAIPVVRPPGSKKIYIDIADLDAFIEKNKNFYA